MYMKFVWLKIFKVLLLLLYFGSDGWLHICQNISISKIDNSYTCRG